MAIKETRKNNKAKNLLSILIPVYNEENTLQKVLENTSTLPITNYEIIIVDDASKDKSHAIINDFLKKNRAKNVTLKHYRHILNRGKGAGIQTALQHADGEYFVIQDADLEYDPKDILKLLARAHKGNYDVVYGSRFLGNIKGMPKANYLANRGYNVILRALYNTRITDMHTCYKLVRTSLIKELGITSNGFDYATELISKILKRGIIVHEVPIGFSGRTKKEGKKIDVMDGIECAYKLLRFRFAHSEKMFTEKSTTFWRFLIVGAAGFGVNYSTLVAFVHFAGLSHIVSEFIAAAIALQVTFLLHDRWTYILHAPVGTVRLGLRARYISYLISNAFGSLMTAVAFGFLFSVLNRLPALLLAAIIGLIWNYIMNTYVIWQRKK